MHTIKQILIKIINAFKHITITTPVAIIISSAILSGGLMGYATIMQGTNPGANLGANQGGNQEPNKMFVGDVVSAKDYVYGKRNSDVIVVEYSDAECPYCTSLHPTIKQIQATYKDKIAFVYRHFPLTQIHPNAFDEARAISCAGKVGGDNAYYAYLNNLFDYKNENKTTQLPANGKEMLAQKTNLDVKAFNACMSSNETASVVDAHQQEGATNGVNGTPATLVLVKAKGGYEIVASISGAQPAPVFTAAIEEALNR